ncbi:YkgJ family cysteine cluster protein (plasmid) [Xylella fastidiosa]|jgi:Fe-S-cluster containining protein|uniref:YkgJ family cysteine cluster protein n=1 Tax=Xylella fastidiosa TaxID=2371 RepID=UPI00021442BA|nr:YkgJ family cysteine cluster protein [Xylella fastidiosa]EGO80787.1 Fe-S-cluster oxidoreductase [Xylella fastidiosa EB92.1]MDC7964517.1 YkgJ family cysteine cluster protein [Xylella fastidiosa]QIS27008.1 YkgJ family cysteine cluster protein [Xylella fastidiosa]RWA34647.1 YkgJ family cysteine cluster protein [Xylella fastidiosa subsp. fastidiosa]RWA39182.1 YkgJ family cysteine cluster protein [Xylella fastidiosa subsp. fastidiosa]
MTKISERNIKVARKNVRKNIQRLNKKLSNKIKNEEAALPDIIAGTHGTPIEKLLALYKLSDPIFTAIRPFTACRYGCSACCHYKVDLLPIEAELIAISLGQAPLPLPTTFQNGHGKRCPFLSKNGQCNIYSIRPMACRRHFMFTNSDYWCNPVRSEDFEIKMLGFSGIIEAYNNIANQDGRNGRENMRDIRDYFTAGIDADVNARELDSE